MRERPARAQGAGFERSRCGLGVVGVAIGVVGHGLAPSNSHHTRAGVAVGMAGRGLTPSNSHHTPYAIVDKISMAIAFNCFLVAR
jgi:hypothetical protein